MSDQLVAYADTYTTRNKDKRRTIRVLSVIRTRDPRNRAAADLLRLRPHSHRDRIPSTLWSV